MISDSHFGDHDGRFGFQPPRHFHTIIACNIKEDGLENRPAYIACHGKVYDVTQSFLWQSGKHQVLHFAGSDLSNELLDAPHDMDLVERFPVVGVLIDKREIDSGERG